MNFPQYGSSLWYVLSHSKRYPYAWKGFYIPKKELPPTSESSEITGRAFASKEYGNRMIVRLVTNPRGVYRIANSDLPRSRAIVLARPSRVGGGVL